MLPEQPVDVTAHAPHVPHARSTLVPTRCRSGASGGHVWSPAALRHARNAAGTPASHAAAHVGATHARLAVHLTLVASGTAAPAVHAPALDGGGAAGNPAYVPKLFDTAWHAPPRNWFTAPELAHAFVLPYVLVIEPWRQSGCVVTEQGADAHAHASGSAAGCSTTSSGANPVGHAVVAGPNAITVQPFGTV
jgi:hypothetical protein